MSEPSQPADLPGALRQIAELRLRVLELEAQRDAAQAEAERLHQLNESIRSESRRLFDVYMEEMAEIDRQRREADQDKDRRISELEERAERHAVTNMLSYRPFQVARMAAESQAVDPEDPDGRVFVFIDLDSFKAVNDTVGHETGDQALSDFAQIFLVSALRHDMSERSCFHLHGDEFGGIFPESKAPVILQEIERQLPTLQYGGIVLRMSAGIGRTWRAAEANMYRNKALQGRAPR